MENFTLKFGKYKGMQFLSTPVSYQNWLLSQDWFKAPKTDAMTNAQKQFSESRRKLGNWNGYSKRGQAIYDSMFEAEKAMESAIFNSTDENSPFWDGVYSWER